MGVHPLQAWRERQAPAMSRAELARLLEVARSNVTRWEAGDKAIGKYALAKIVSKTGIPAAELRPDLAALMAPSKPPEQSEPVPIPAQG